MGQNRHLITNFGDNKEPGIYVDIVSGEPLFSSQQNMTQKQDGLLFTKPLTKRT
ncbi:MAG: hypothetical protein CM1200mP1_03380 [Candidatus Neomarinimicrobiota bacterium]|nr:MAG: hypothetical protein CM1200mP1_03380 [Candidatus Neomarinimicrobiota bacterium]